MLESRQRRRSELARCAEGRRPDQPECSFEVAEPSGRNEARLGGKAGNRRCRLPRESVCSFDLRQTRVALHLDWIAVALTARWRRILSRWEGIGAYLQRPAVRLQHKTLSGRFLPALLQVILQKWRSPSKVKYRTKFIIDWNLLKQAD